MSPHTDTDTTLQTSLPPTLNPTCPVLSGHRPYWNKGVRLFGSGSCADSTLHKDTRPGGHNLAGAVAALAKPVVLAQELCQPRARSTQREHCF